MFTAACSAWHRQRYSARMTLCPAPSPRLAPFPWVRRFTPCLPPASRVLDVACGSGRHVAWLISQGHQVTGLDRDAAALAQLPAGATALQADIESAPWPLPGQQFDAVVVTHYLWRALWPQLLESVRPGGVLIYETFAEGNAAYGKPARPDFLLRPGELLQAPLRVVQRMVAVRPPVTPASVALEATGTAAAVS